MKNSTQASPCSFHRSPILMFQNQRVSKQTKNQLVLLMPCFLLNSLMSWKDHIFQICISMSQKFHIHSHPRNKVRNTAESDYLDIFILWNSKAASSDLQNSLLDKSHICADHLPPRSQQMAISKRKVMSPWKSGCILNCDQGLEVFSPSPKIVYSLI